MYKTSRKSTETKYQYKISIQSKIGHFGDFENNWIAPTRVEELHNFSIKCLIVGGVEHLLNINLNIGIVDSDSQNGWMGWRNFFS